MALVRDPNAPAGIGEWARRQNPLRGRRTTRDTAMDSQRRARIDARRSRRGEGKPYRDDYDPERRARNDSAPRRDRRAGFDDRVRDRFLLRAPVPRTPHGE